ncbi:MAG: DUF6259 domain-containing protein [Clostridia bacterium]
MEMKLTTLDLCVALNGESLEITVGGENIPYLSAQDEVEEIKWLRSARNWQTFDREQLLCATFQTAAKTTHGDCQAEYLLAVRKDLPCVLIATRLLPGSECKPELPMKWLHFTAGDVRSIHTMEPGWSCERSQMKIATSFAKDVVLEGTQGCVGLFHSGEPIYDPKANRVRPDMWVETVGLTGFQPVHTAVIAYAPDAAHLERMREQADALYRQALPLLKMVEPVYMGTSHVFHSGALSFTLTENSHGVALTQMRSIGEATALCLPLTQLYLQELQTEKTFAVDTLSGWDDVKLFRENKGGRLQLCGIRDWPELSVEVEFTLDPHRQRVEWQTHVLNAEQQLSVLSVSYVPSPWGASQAQCFVPEHCGWVAQEVMDTHFCRDGIYPRGWRFTMSYFAAYTQETENNGFYCGLHDPHGSYRTMNMETDPITHTGMFFARAHAMGMGLGGNAFTAPGAIVWQLFSGDWYDATLIYKEFVHRQAEWLPKVGPEGREDTPLWFKELPVWIMDWMPNTNPLAEAIPTSLSKDGNKLPDDYWYEEPLKLQRALGTPVGYHVYNWHWIPFNNDYPYYLPAKKEFQENLKGLQDNGVRVMPYTNARLWDTHDREGEDWHFTSHAKAWATKDSKGKLFTEKYESHEPNGQLCELAAMCPSSGVWKAQLAQVLQGLFGDLHVDGVYMDQIAAAAPYPCQDPGHNHLPGGGGWWAEQYNLLMRRSRQIRGAEGILTTEDNAEVYMRAMDGFLSWIWTFDHLVPAFSVIYAGYVAMLGRTTNGLKKGDEAFLKYETAEQLVFGGQLGWLNADIVERPREFAFFRKMVQLRYRYSPFFYKGEALRPAELKCDRPSTITTPMYFDTKLLELQPMVTGTWRLWDGTRTLLFIINCDGEQASFTARLRAAGYTVVEGSGRIDQTVAENGQLLLSGTVNAEDYLVLELTEAE